MMGLDTRALCAVADGRLLAGNHRKLGPVSLDSRSVGKGQTFFCIRGPRFDGHHFAGGAAERGAAVVVADRKGVSNVDPRLLEDGTTVVVVPETVKALGRLGAEARNRFRGKVIGLTGSSGKTTTKEMLAAVLRQAGETLATHGNHNNELGVPLTLLRLQKRHAFAVVEMGMNAPGEIATLAEFARPKIGVITTVGAAHLEGLGTVANIARAKGELLDALPYRGLAVIPSDVVYPWRLTAGLRCPLITVGEREVDEIRLIGVRPLRTGIAGTIEVYGERHRLALRLDGRHNLRNALLAIAVGHALGVPVGDCIAALRKVEPPSMRGEIRRLGDGGAVVVDCYNANPQSMWAAVSTFVARAPDGLLVLGDMLELGAGEQAAHADIGRAVAGLAAGLTLLGVGPRSAHMVEAARAAGMPAERAVHVADAEAAGAWVADRRRPRQSILLKGSRGVRLERVFTAVAGEGAVR